MTAPRDPDDILMSWLSEGPTRLPDPTRRAILVGLSTVGQRRVVLHGRWRSVRTSILMGAPAATAIVVIAIGMGLYRASVTGPAGSTPTVTPSPAASYQPRLSEQTIELTIRILVKQDENLAGRLAEPKVTKLTLLAPGEPYDIVLLDGQRRGTTTVDNWSWAVEFDGTNLIRRRSNEVFACAAGLLIIDDATLQARQGICRDPDPRPISISRPTP